MTTSSHLTAFVVLPQRYNADEQGHKQPVEDDKFDRSMAEIAGKFGGGFLWRFGDQAPRGFWWDQGVLYQDEHTVLEVDIPNDQAAKAWLLEYARTTLGPRFDQKAIYIRFVGPIQVEVVTIEFD